jgi:hypothetical protein
MGLILWGVMSDYNVVQEERHQVSSCPSSIIRYAKSLWQLTNCI